MNLKENHWVLFFAVTLIFVLVEFNGLGNPMPGDENVYYYMGKAIFQGQVPYRDFFYAHPPLHILILAAIIKIFGVNFFALKVVNLLSLLAASFFLYKISFEFSKNEPNAHLVPALCLVLFLFSFVVMFNADFSNGISFAAVFVLACLYFVIKENYFIGGMLGGLAGLTRFYAAIVVFTILIFYFIRGLQKKKIRDFLGIFLGFSIVFGLAMVFLMLAFGNAFLNPTIKYHLLKLKLPNQRTAVYKNLLTENWPIILAFLSSIFIKNKKRFQLIYFIILTYLAFLLALNVPEEFYFIIIFPFMAIIGSHSLAHLLSLIRKKYIKYGLVALLCAVFLWNLSGDIFFIENVMFSKFEELKPITEKISSAGPQLKIFGDDSVVPMIGLLTDKKIALNYIDANEMRFTSGLSNFYLFADQLDKEKISYMVFIKDHGLFQIAQFRQYAQSRCSLEKIYQDRIFGYILLYKC